MFKNFSEFNSESNQLPLVKCDELTCANAQAQNVRNALEYARGAAQRYASSYAKVATWDYSNGGKPRDVTSSERTSVADNVLSQASSKLKSVSDRLRQYLATPQPAEEGKPANGSILDVWATTVCGATLVKDSWYSLIKPEMLFRWELDEPTISSIMANCAAATIDTNLRKVTFPLDAEEFADRVVKRHFALPRVAVWRGNEQPIFVSAFDYSSWPAPTKTETMNGIYLGVFDPSVDEIYVVYVQRMWDVTTPTTDIVYKYNMQRKAGDQRWLYTDYQGQTRTISSEDWFEDLDKHAYTGAYLALRGGDPEGINWTEAAGITTENTGSASADIHVATGSDIIAEVPIRNDYTSMTIGSPEQLDSLATAIAPTA